MYTERCNEKLKAVGAPLVGWYCEEVIDWGEATFTCELCGYKNVRFVHVMVHKDFSEKLRVGCICAGNLEGDIFAAKVRDKEARAKSRRKKNFLKKEWREESGMLTLRFKNQKLTIEQDSFLGRSYFKIDIVEEDAAPALRLRFLGRSYFKIDIDGDCYQWKSNRRIETLTAAKEYIFELL